MPEPKRPLKVFLCHASKDKPKVRELYKYLKKRGIQPWFDEEDLLGGQDWQVEIPKALATSDAIIICLTKNSVDKEGYIQKEIKFALDKALEMPEGRIFLIPVKFEECKVPFTLSRYQWVDLTVESGFAKMMKALKFRASQLERATVELLKPPVFIEDEKSLVEKKAQKSIEIAVREKIKRETVEKAARRITEHQFATKAARTNFTSKAVPFLRVIGILVIIILLSTTSTQTLVFPQGTLEPHTVTAEAQLITHQSIIPPEVMTGTWESSTGMRYTIVWKNDSYEVALITHPTLGQIDVHSQLWQNGVLTWQYQLRPGDNSTLVRIRTDYINEDNLYVSMQNMTSNDYLSYVSQLLNRVH